MLTIAQAYFPSIQEHADTSNDSRPVPGGTAYTAK